MSTPTQAAENWPSNEAMRRHLHGTSDSLPEPRVSVEVPYEQFDALWMLFEQYSAEFKKAGKPQPPTQG